MLKNCIVRLNVPSRIFQRSLSNLPKVGQYKKLSEGTAEDFQNSQIHFAQHGSPEAIAKRLLGMVRNLENKGKYLVKNCTFSGFSHYTAGVLVFKYLALYIATILFTGMVNDLKGLNIGCLVDLHDHSIQTATRALKDGADEETVICGLLHDIGGKKVLVN